MFACECGCGLIFEKNSTWMDADDLRKSENQFVLHPDCKNINDYKFVVVGNDFLIVEDLK